MTAMERGAPAAFCGRPGHPQPYTHRCAPQCPSISLRSKEQCHKDEGHEDFHWIVRSGGIEAWGPGLYPPASADEADRRRLVTIGALTYGGNYDEWGIACPDGVVWDDVAATPESGRSMLATADKDCGCEELPHILVWREVPEWEAAS